MREERAAILLTALPPEEREQILTRLGPERGGRLRAEMRRIGQAPGSRDVLEQVLRDFEALLERGPVSDREAPRAEVKKVAEPPARPAPPAPADQPAVSADALARDPLAVLREMEAEQVAAVLEGEHPRTVSLVLNALETEQAGRVLKGLQPKTRREASLCLGQTSSGSRDVLQRIARALVQKSQTLRAHPEERHGGDARYKKIADLLRSLDKAERMEILNALEQQEAETAARIKDFLYEFDDVLRLEDRSLQKLLAEIDGKNLALALRGATPAVAEKVMNNLAKRAREMLNDEMEFLGSVAPAKVQQAQKMVVEVLQRLDQAGELVMGE